MSAFASVPALPMLFAMKKAGRLRYVGITTSEGRRHREVEDLMRRHPLDFVQVTYNLLDREVEDRILPLARERGIAVIANRPFREGALLRELQRHRLPVWAADIDCTVSAVARALTIYGRAIEAGGTDGLLAGRPVAPALREYAAPRQVRTHEGSFT